MIAGSGLASLFEERCARSGFLERQWLRIERGRQVGHVEDVLPEAADVLARVRAEVRELTKAGGTGCPSPSMADSAVVMSATLGSMTALTTRLAYLSCFSCSTGSPLLMTGPPKETQSRKSLKASILVVSARIVRRVSASAMNRSRNG